MMQIRYIDKNGMEKIRFDRSSSKKGEVLKIRDSRLQDKSKRYYFINSKNKKNNVWFSALDLNIERGRVELPFNPTYRAVLPIYKNGLFNGILITNYFAKPLLKTLFYMPVYDAVLFDEEGYILKHYDKKKEWSRYRDKSFKIEKRYINNNGSKEYTGEGFVVHKLELPLQNHLYLLLKPSSKNQLQQEKIYQNRATKVIIFFLSIILGICGLLFFILKKLESRDLYIDILTKKKQEQNTILKQKAKMASMGEMIANIAHQWRQPLSVISLQTTNLERKLKRGKADKEFLENFIKKIHKTVDNMNTTIEDFSNFFKPNKEKADFELNHLVEECLDIVKKPFHENNILICFDPLQASPYHGYKNELLQVLLNIINNSKDAIQINSIKNPKIAIEIFNEKDKYILKLSDNAGGIPEDILDRIFEPYFTTKFKSEGTGIGLYMCKLIIEDSMKGAIGFANENNGAVCTIILPKG